MDADRANPQPSGRNRRSVRNILIKPKGQVRLVFAIPIAGLLTAAVLHETLKGTFVARLAEVEAAIPAQAGILEQLQDNVRDIFNLGAGFILVCLVMVAVFGLLISHRFYGPLVPILRSLRAMKEASRNGYSCVTAMSSWS
jgi:hypothetical protein